MNFILVQKNIRLLRIRNYPVKFNLLYRVLQGRREDVTCLFMSKIIYKSMKKQKYYILVKLF